VRRPWPSRGPGGLLLPSLLLVAALAVHGAKRVDEAVQDRLFDFESKTWCVDSRAAAPRALFYGGPKIAYAALALLLAVRLAVRRPLSAFVFSRREACYLLLCLLVVPATVGTIKRATAVPCPWEVDRYGGELAHRTLFSPPPAAASRAGHCFPAAHASGGFALLAFAFVARNARRRRFAAVLGCAVGATLATYQTLRGAHYLSHTLVTMLLAWLVVAALARLLGLRDPAAPELGRGSET